MVHVDWQQTHLFTMALPDARFTIRRSVVTKFRGWFSSSDAVCMQHDGWDTTCKHFCHDAECIPTCTFNPGMLRSVEVRQVKSIESCLQDHVDYQCCSAI